MLPRALSTGEVAAQINLALGSRVYAHRHIRAEIDAGRLRAYPLGRGRVGARPRFRVRVDDFLAWAGAVLHQDDMARLRASMPSAS